jgi:2-polyprenyl-6-methoxyphenol hydroxylase-like FAD-dependent oxidoreductase
MEGPDGRLGPFDLIVAADGARSRIRRFLRLASKDVGYPYAAVWSVVDDPDGLAGDVLTQAYDTTRVTLGVLPTGVRQASIFWLLRSRELDRAVAGGPEWLRVAGRPYAGKLSALLDGVTTVLGARYRDVVTPRPFVTDRQGGVVLVGDAAHAMSPQLGMGASLAFADGWSLADAVRRHPGDLRAALESHAAGRRAHVRWYTWLSRIMTPVFQSDLVPVGWARDMAFGPLGRVPWVRDQFVGIEMGRQTSPWTSWSPPTRSAPTSTSH